MSFRVSSGESFETVHYVIDRIFETFIGIVIAILVNYYIKPPNPFIELKSLNNEMTEFIAKIVNKEGNFNRIKNLEEYSLKIDEFRSLIEFYHKEINAKKYDVDIKYYMKHLALFRSAYSYMYILDSIKEGLDVDIKQYHIENLIDIKNQLLK